MKHLKSALTVALLACTASANAAVITDKILFSGSGNLAQSYDFTSGDIDLRATGHRLNSDGSIGELERISQFSTGLGVLNNDDTYCYNYFFGSQYCYQSDQHFVDSDGFDEVVQLAFSQAVTLEKLWFTYAGKYDDFSFSVIDNGSVSAFYGHVDIDDSYGAGTYTFSGNHVSDTFGIGAYGHGDAFKLKAVQYSYTALPEVPLPAAGLLLLGALGGLGLMRLRKSR